MVVNKNASPTDAVPTTKATLARHGHRPISRRARHTPAHHHTPFHHALHPMGLGCQQRSHLLYTGPCIVPPRDTPHSCQPLLCAKHLIAYIIALSGACRRGSSPLRSPFATLLSSGRLHAQRRWHSNSHPYHSYTQTRHRRNSFRVAQLYV